MARGDQLSRQWKIIQALSAARQGKSAAQLAEELSCHSRTVYRDLVALEQAGFPLYTDRKDAKTFWSLIDVGKQQMPMPLTLTELMALHFSRNVMRVLQGTVFHDALASLFEKVKATLPQAYLSYLETIEHTLQVGARACKPHGDIQSILSKVQEAVRKKRRMEINYFTMSRRTMTNRRIWPYQLWYYDETFYLIAYCETRKEPRLFAVDRIQELTVLAEGFEPPEGFDAAAHMQKSFGVFQGKSVTVQILFSAQTAGYIREKIWHPSQRLTSRPDGGLLFTAEVAGIDEIKYWILQWGASAKVLKPDALRQAVVEQASTIVANYCRDAELSAANHD